MIVMHVGRMIVIVDHAIVTMRMTVLPSYFLGVRMPMLMMPIVVPMGVLMLDRIVGMLVMMLLGEVKSDTGREEHPRDRGLRRPLPFPQRERHRRGCVHSA